MNPYRKLKQFLIRIYYFINYTYMRIVGEENWAKSVYRKHIGQTPNLKEPKTLNEKIVWLKLNYQEDYYALACDKYLLHQYLYTKFGKDYAVPMIIGTKDVNEIRNETIKEFPCIVKISNGSGQNLVIHKKNQYSDAYLQSYLKAQIVSSNYHARLSLEHQYMKKNPYIVVERLLTDASGKIPNDYKFLYINGKLQFIYCSIDRMGDNVRQIYDSRWNRLHFIWVQGANKHLFDEFEKSTSIPKPDGFEEMVKISAEIAKDFPLVRVDFYDVEGCVYVGEITLHHGSGSDSFFPESYDVYYGQKLKLPLANK